MLFKLQLIISFLAGGIFIAIQSLLGEYFRGVMRGIMLTIPSTIALGLFFIGLTKSPADAVHAAIIICAAFAPAYLFVMTFSLFIRRGILAAALTSYSVWAASAFFIMKFPPATFVTAIFLYCLPVIIFAYAVTIKINRGQQEPELKKFPINAKNIIARGIIGGTIIVLAVVLSKTIGNVVGGIFSAFPAVFTSIFVIYYGMQGPKAIPTVSKTLFFPGVLGMILYAIIAALTFPIYGIWLGTLAAYATTFLFLWVYVSAKKILT